MEMLYHVSPTPGLTVLEPGVTEYFGKPRQVCLTASLPMALMYGIKHFEYAYGYTRDGRIFYEEYFPNALEELYRGEAASLYTCFRRPDMETTPIPNEYVTPNEVPVDAELPIPDVCEALLEQERLGSLKIVRWDEMDEGRRRWVVRAEADTILEKGLLDRPDDPFARYMREKYPESWALAENEAKEGKALDIKEENHELT